MTDDALILLNNGSHRWCFRRMGGFDQVAQELPTFYATGSFCRKKEASQNCHRAVDLHCSFVPVGGRASYDVVGFYFIRLLSLKTNLSRPAHLSPVTR